MMLTRRLGRRAAARQQVEDAVAIRLERGRERQLVLLRRLPRDARAVVLRVVVGRRGPAQVGIVEVRLRLLRLVPVDAVGELLRDTLARRHEEPERVALERTAKAFASVAGLLHGAEAVRIQVTREQLRGDVLRRELRARVRHGRDARELVAAVLRNHVDLHAAAVAVGADAGGLDDDFLYHELGVDEDALRGVRQLLVHAVHVRLRLGAAVHAVTGLRSIARAADTAGELLRQRRAGNDVGEDREPSRA